LQRQENTRSEIKICREAAYIQIKYLSDFNFYFSCPFVLYQMFKRKDQNVLQLAYNVLRALEEKLNFDLKA